MKKHRIRNFFIDLNYGIRNLISWTPIIWADRDWCQFFLYKILRLKLSRMEKLQRKYGHSVDSHKYADQLKVCVNLLDRLLKDEYHEMVFKNHDKKWGETHFNFIPLEDKPDLLELKITRDNVKTEVEKEKERKEYRILCEAENKLRKQDIKYLCYMINKYVEHWWD